MPKGKPARPPVSRSASLSVRPGTAVVAPAGDSAPAWRANAQGDSALERTMDHIGMGRYHWTLLVRLGVAHTGC